MPDHDPSPPRPSPCRSGPVEPAHVASVGAALRSAYAVDAGVPPAMQAALDGLTDDGDRRLQS